MELVSYDSSSRSQLVSVRPSACPSTQCLRSSASRGNFILVGFLYLSQHLLFSCFPTLGKILALRWIISNPFHIRSRLFLQFQYLESATLFTLFHSFSCYGCFWFLIIGLNSQTFFLLCPAVLLCSTVFLEPCILLKSLFVFVSNPVSFQIFLRIFKVCSQSGWSKFPWHLNPVSVL